MAPVFTETLNSMSIDTIIVNYNAGDALQECVAALLGSSQHSNLTVVDNASEDGSAEKLQNLYGHQQAIKFLLNPSNFGFAKAVNAVARRSSADWILILNPDCIMETGSLGRLKEALESDPTAALAGPLVQDESGRTQRATLRRFPNPWNSLVTVSGLRRLGRWFPAFDGIEIDPAANSAAVIKSEAVSGACMLVRQKAFAEVGFMDEQYAMHCEDLDLMYRLKLAGWHCLFVSEATCVHHQGMSSRSRPTWVHYQKHRGMVRFFKKFQADSLSFPIRLLVYAGIWLRFLVRWPLILIRR